MNAPANNAHHTNEQAAHDGLSTRLYRIKNTLLNIGDVLYDQNGRSVGQVTYLAHGPRHSDLVVHTCGGDAYRTRGGYLLGLSNRKPY
ncbi:hypothetical protein [Caballeronia sp. TF1N1]|uniref:hypothetical protein n=1 Tax=Caballeronia sp. TF1N1 TaxID=2878153 RepID=UPI001FD26B05|nr:hypothetical protein [Caballeronia sp. TF1N1]